MVVPTEHVSTDAPRYRARFILLHGSLLLDLLGFIEISARNLSPLQRVPLEINVLSPREMVRKRIPGVVGNPTMRSREVYERVERVDIGET